MNNQQKDIRIQPSFCQYVNGMCDQDFSGIPFKGGFFIYPSDPSIISKSIELGIEQLRASESSLPWTSWRDLPIAGQIIFCEICKAARFASFVVADVTTLNFNVAFEIGYSIGLGLPVLPVRDTTFNRDKKIFNELGLLDTFGYLDFQNAKELIKGVKKRIRSPMATIAEQEINRNQPLYFLKSPIDTDGSIKLLSSLKKSALHFRTFDPRETARLSLHEARKQTSESLGVITYLLDPARKGSLVHNARSAFVAGLAMAAGKRVLMIEEGYASHPIDYRDVVQAYTSIEQIPSILSPFFRDVIIRLQELSPLVSEIPAKRLENVDLGDLAAENEIRPLQSYFVRSGQYQDTRRGHARLVVGRKGSGKTAIFYRVRDHYYKRKSYLVLDLKPEGHQFTKLRETVLNELTPGLQAHTMTALWNYMILLEIANKILNQEASLAYRDPKTKEKYDQVLEAYGEDIGSEQGDFSERLLRLVDSINTRRNTIGPIRGTPEITNLVYIKDIKNIQEALDNYLSDKDEIWVLIDNLDKGWPVRGSTNEDVMILRCLLEAARKIQRQFERKNLEFKTIVFIRNDIYEHLLMETPDKGKDTVISLEWNDPEFFKEIIKLRLETSTNVKGNFDEIWAIFFDSHIGAEDSFRYLLDRTLMRPRDIIRFVRKSVEVAINRNHDKVIEEDMLQAEIDYSEDTFQDIVFELRDVNPKYQDVLYSFLNCKPRLSYKELETLIAESGVNANEIQDVIKLLTWFGFLGLAIGSEKIKYSYQVKYNLQKLDINQESIFVIHPAFRSALECQS